METAVQDKSQIDKASEEAWNIVRSNPKKCLELSMDLLSRSEQAGYAGGKAQALSNIGGAKVWLSRYDEALTTLYQARELFSALGNKSREAQVVYHIFCSFYFLADYDNALTYAHRLLELANESNDDNARANAYNGIGTIYYTIGENKKSIDNLEKGLKLAEKGNDFHLLARILDGIGTAYLHMNQREKALQFMLRSWEAVRESGRKNEEGYALSGLASVYHSLKNIEKAEEFYLAAIRLRKETDFKPGVADSLSSLGGLYLDENRTDEAMKCLQEALELGEEIDSNEVLYKVHQSLARYYSEKKNFESFREHLEKCYHHKELLVNDQNLQKMKTAEMQMKMEQVEKEKKMLEKKHKELENHSRNLDLLSSLGKQITACLNVRDINRTVYDLLSSIMNVGGFGIGIYHAEENTIEFPGYIEEGKVYESKYRLDDRNRLPVICFTDNQEILIRDFEAEIEKYVTRPGKPVVGKNVHSLIYLPVRSDKGKTGVITVQSFEKNAYNEYHLNVLRNLAVYCAIALENAANYEKLEEVVQARTLEVKKSYETTKILNDLGQQITSLTRLEDIFQKTYSGISQMMEAECFGIRLLLPEKNAIQYKFEIEHGKILEESITVSMDNENNFSVWCVKNRQAIFTNDFVSEHTKWVKKLEIVTGDVPHSLMFQPLVTGDKMLGAITVQSFKRNTYQHFHLDILKTLANYTAIAIQNASFINTLEETVKKRTEEIVKQKEQVEKTASHTKMISEIGKEIASLLSAEDIIQTVYKNINGLMDADAFGIGIYRPQQNDLFHTGVMEKGKKLPDFSFPLDEERVAAICFSKSREIIINDWTNEYRQYVSKEYSAKAGDAPVSMIYMPLYAGNKTIGVMSVQSFKKGAYESYHLDMVRSLAVYIGNALENANLYQNLEVRVKERTGEIEKAYENTRLLSQISKEIASSLSAETIIETIYKNINQLMDADGFGIGLYDREAGQIRFPGYIEKGEKIVFSMDVNDDRLATWCLKKQKEIFINNYPLEYSKYIKGMKAPVAGKDSSSIIYLPLYLKDAVTGVITVQSFEVNAYTEYHLDILRNLAQSIASALENAKLYTGMEEQVKERTAELVKQKEQVEKAFSNTKAISEIGREISSLLSAADIISKLYASVNTLLDATIFGVAVYREAENDLYFSGVMERGERLPDFSYPLAEEKIATLSFKNQQEIIINDWNKEFKKYLKKDYKAVQGELPESMIYMPVYSKKKVIGVITAQSFKTGAYNDYHADVLRSLSVYVGSALENASLYEGLEERVKERTEEIDKAYQDTKLLSRISKEISSSLSVETIVASVYKNVNALMDAASFGIGVYIPEKHTIYFPGFIEKGQRHDNVEFHVDDDRLAGWCFRNQKEIVTNDYTKDYNKFVKGIKAVVAGKHSRSIIYIPLFAKEKIIGVLTIQSYEENAYSDYHLDILRNLANSISIAIENATLYSNLEEKVKERTAEVVKQKEIIEEKNKHITDSIIYAKRIQRAILPPEETFNAYLKNSFVLYKPKDIVSGDFYWIERKDNKILFAVVDCTGHGVPGAFMSIIGYNGLNQIVNEYHITQPAEILNRLNIIITNTLKQHADQSKIRDGMDMSVCCVDLNNNKLEYAGANNPIFIVRQEKIIEIKADKHPIGNFVGEKEFRFTNKEMELKPDDRLYLFSDGYADQFGGPRGKKLKYSQFRDLLTEHHQKPMRQQKEILDALFEEWRGDLEQLDDVCIIGVKV